ncbi:hypothetical protein V8F20_012370 [Naviculisporaceae sp. PSN 640]
MASREETEKMASRGACYAMPISAVFVYGLYIRYRGVLVSASYKQINLPIDTRLLLCVPGSLCCLVYYQSLLRD